MSLLPVKNDISKKDQTTWPHFVAVWLKEGLPTIWEIRRRLNAVIAAFGSATSVPVPGAAVRLETSFDLLPTLGTPGSYAAADHSHGSPPTPVTGLTPIDATIVVSSTTGAISIRVGTVTAANLPSTVLVDSDMQDVADLVQELVLLLHDFVRVEMGLEPVTGLVA